MINGKSNWFVNMRFFWLLILVCFFVWLLPLGVFIKPSHEQTACGGQRAICLCSHSLVKSSAHDAGKIAFSSSSGAHKERSLSGGVSAGNYFVRNNAPVASVRFSRLHFSDSPHSYSLLICASLEHIPKA
jgi:hypothetical protein